MEEKYGIDLQEDMALTIQVGNNNIEVIGEETDSSFISIDSERPDLQKDFVEMVEENRIFLRVRPDLEMEGKNSYKLHLPNAWEHKLQVETSNGCIKVKKLRGEARIQTTNGNTEVEDFSGDLYAQSTKGAIEGRRTWGKLEFSVSDGRINLRDSEVSGGSIKSGSGKISLQIRPAGRGNLNIFSGNGQVLLALPPDGDFNLRVQTKEELNNHMDGGQITSDKDITTIRRGEGIYDIMVINFQGGVRLTNFSDFDKDWQKKEPFDFGNMKLPDPSKVLEDLFNYDMSKDLPRIMKQMAEFGDRFGKVGEEITRKFDEFKRGFTNKNNETEVKVILQMLKDGKISTEEAEKLISALRKK